MKVLQTCVIGPLQISAMQLPDLVPSFVQNSKDCNQKASVYNVDCFGTEVMVVAELSMTSIWGVCNSKDCGSIGVLNMRTFNLTLFSKWLSEMGTKERDYG